MVCVLKWLHLYEASWNLSRHFIFRLYTQLISYNKTTCVFLTEKQSLASSLVSIQSQLGPAELNEAHAYVPYVYARDAIARIMGDMKKMKATHLVIVGDIEANYKGIEKETQVGKIIITFLLQLDKSKKCFPRQSQVSTVV